MKFVTKCFLSQLRRLRRQLKQARWDFEISRIILHLLNNEVRIVICLILIWTKCQGGNSQNILDKFVTFFVTLGNKILRFFRLKVLLEADIIKE